MKKIQEESKIYNIHAKAPTPPQTKSNHKLLLKPSHMGGKHQVPKLKRVVTKQRGFSMQKSILPIKPRRIKSDVKLNKRCQLPLK
jgi:hypothetical protein